jgi:copper transport protein
MYRKKDLLYMRRGLIITLTIIGMVLIFSVKPVLAHANLLRSDPPANAALDTSPIIIRLWFTEPLEPDFSRFTVRDSSGTVVATPPSQVDPADHTQLVMRPSTLPDGLYTVSWRVLSTDGHSTEGSFSFGIGVAVTSEAALPSVDESIPPDSAFIRWFNLLSMSLSVGSIGFLLFVWKPAVPQGQEDIERRMNWTLGFGWVFLGLTGILMLLLQVSTAVGITVLEATTHPALSTVLSSSRYGQIWQARLILWLGLGGVCWFARSERWLYWVALVLGVQLLLTNSLYNHASAVQQNTAAAVAGDWLHLTATALWFGGLIQFFVVIGTVKRYFADTTGTLSSLVGHFSNFARVTVVMIIISGFYAAWLQVGSIEALFTTIYGRSLLIKLVLIVPLLGISAVNLFFTQRGLQRGQNIWTNRLRGLVGAEITLLLAIIAVVGVMTAIAPARTVVAVRNAEMLEPDVQPFFQMQIADTLMAHLEITPGYVGENTFTVTLYDSEGNPLSDASLIRLRFDHTEQTLGQSELRPELAPDGTYTVTGSNLSIPGTWRVRMTVQRPNEFDTLLDFEPNIPASPPPPIPVIDTAIPAASQLTALLAGGFALLIVSGFFIGQHGIRPLNGSNITALTGIFVGIIFLASAAGVVGTVPDEEGEFAVRNAWTLPLGMGMTGGVYLTLENGTNQDERLIGAFTDAAESVEIHQTQIEENIARMRPMTALDIPAGESLAIAPGQYHLMLVNLQRDLSVGETIAVTLHFESGIRLTVEVPVQYEAGQ